MQGLTVAAAVVVLGLVPATLGFWQNGMYPMYPDTDYPDYPMAPGGGNFQGFLGGRLGGSQNRGFGSFNNGGSFSGFGGNRASGGYLGGSAGGRGAGGRRGGGLGSFLGGILGGLGLDLGQGSGQSSFSSMMMCQERDGRCVRNCENDDIISTTICGSGMVCCD